MCQTFEYSVPNVHCNGCKDKITSSITSVEGVEGVEVEIGSGTVTVRAEADVTDASLREALASAGYPAAA